MHHGDHDRRSVSSQPTQLSAPAVVGVSDMELDVAETLQPVMNLEQLLSPRTVIRGGQHDSLVDQVLARRGNPSWTGLSERPRKANSPIAAGFEAEMYLKKELANNQRLGAFERESLIVAINLIPQIGGSRHDWSRTFEQLDLDSQALDDPSMYPSTELMCFLSNGKSTPSGQIGRAYRI